MDIPMYDFSEEEIREQLEKFGFHDIPDDKLGEFKKDLDILIRAERSKLAAEARENMSYTSESTTSPEPKLAPPNLPYRPASKPVDQSDGVTIHVTGVDPSMRRMHASATYYPPEERLTRSAPTSPVKSELSHPDSERRTIKRKVLRKVNGAAVIDESFIESESDDSCIFRDVREVTGPSSRRAVTAPAAPVAGHLYIEEPYVKSVIYPMMLPPNERNIRRCDPVARFQEFRDYWEHYKIPGEKSHKSLRWAVRENMLQYEPIVKKTQRTQVPNTYVVPTEKKRMKLRWQVRSQLAQGIMPGTGYVSS